MLGVIIEGIDAAIVINVHIMLNVESDPYSTILGICALGGALIGLFIGLAGNEDNDSIISKIVLAVVGAGFGFVVGSLIGWAIDWVIVGVIAIVSQGWNIAVLPGNIAGGLIGLVYSALVSLVMQRSSEQKKNYMSFGATGAIISTVGGSVLGCVIGLSHNSAQLAFVGAVIGLGAGSLGASLLGGFVGLILHIARKEQLDIDDEVHSDLASLEAEPLNKLRALQSNPQRKLPSD